MPVGRKKNDDDIPVFDMSSERMLAVLDKAYSLTWGGNAWSVQKEGDWTRT